MDHHMNRVTLEATIPAAGAAVAQDNALGITPISGTITDVQIIPEAALAANGTNFRTFRLVNKGQAGSGTTVAASFATDTPTTDDLVAFKAKSLPLTGGASSQVAQGDVLVADETVAAAGVAHSGYRIIVEIER